MAGARKSKMPTRKWWVATVTAVAGVLVLLVQHGWHLDEHTSIMLITLISQRILAYIIGNDDTPGGVPAAPVRADTGQHPG